MAEEGKYSSCAEKRVGEDEVLAKKVVNSMMTRKLAKIVEGRWVEERASQRPQRGVVKRTIELIWVARPH